MELPHFLFLKLFFELYDLGNVERESRQNREDPSYGPDKVKEGEVWIKWEHEIYPDETKHTHIQEGADGGNHRQSESSKRTAEYIIYSTDKVSAGNYYHLFARKRYDGRVIRHN